VGPYQINNTDHVGEVLGIKSLVPHPQYNGTKNDIMLLQLHNISTAQPFEYNRDPGFPKPMNEEDTITIVGFGTTKEGGNVSMVLREVDGIYAFPYESCLENYPIADDQIHLCAGTLEGGKDACDSDSGNPLFINNTIVAVTDDGLGCGRPNVPSINARVSGFADWIEENICKLSQAPPESCKQILKNLPVKQQTRVKSTSSTTKASTGSSGKNYSKNSSRTIFVAIAVVVVAVLVVREIQERRKKSFYQEIPNHSKS
jgi:hypothetical protein